MKIVAVLFVGLFAFSSCVNQQEADDKQQILELLFQQASDWNNGDIDAYMNGYWKSDKLRFASGDRVNYGWETTLSYYKKAYPSKLEMGELVFSDIVVELINSNSAIVFGRWQLTRKTDTPHGLFTLHFKNFSEGWKIISDHTSSGK